MDESERERECVRQAYRFQGVSPKSVMGCFSLLRRLNISGRSTGGTSSSSLPSAVSVHPKPQAAYQCMHAHIWLSRGSTKSSLDAHKPTADVVCMQCTNISVQPVKLAKEEHTDCEREGACRWKWNKCISEAKRGDKKDGSTMRRCRDRRRRQETQ